ncbi:DUF3549 family protein [Aliidiomarina sp. Khilg15.8]
MSQTTLTVDSLTEFLTLGETHYYIFDLSRLVQRIDNDDFAAMEAGQRPFPSPLQQHAWLGIVFWRRDQAQQPFIWFAKFPLDERGLLSHGARQHYLQIIMQALGRDLTAEPTPEQDELLKQNPYVFTPSEDKRAAFHAQVSRLLNQPPSIYFEDAQSFLRGNESAIQWQNLGVQGLHDVISQLPDDAATCNALAQHFAKWPQAFSQLLSKALEQHKLPSTLVSNLNRSLVNAMQNEDGVAIVNHLRALAQHADTPTTRQNLRTLLKDPLVEAQAQDILIVIGARCWAALEDESLRQTYLVALSQQAQELFPHLFADLVAIPQLRPHLLHALRAPTEQPASVQEALKMLKQQVEPNV